MFFFASYIWSCLTDVVTVTLCRSENFTSKKTGALNFETQPLYLFGNRTAKKCQTHSLAVLAKKLRYLRVESTKSERGEISQGLTLYGPCIVTYFRNKNQPDSRYFLIYSNKYPLHVSKGLTIYPQYAVDCICSLRYLSCNHKTSPNLIVLAASQRGCTINAIDCMYSKLPPDDE